MSFAQVDEGIDAIQSPRCELVVTTAADSRYYLFVPFFIFFSLRLRADVCVNLVVDNQKLFSSVYGRPLGFLKELFGDRVVISGRSDELSGIPMNKVRYLQPPKVNAEHVYFSDVDLFLMDDPLSLATEAYHRRTVQFNNHVRPGTQRLTGLHLTYSTPYSHALSAFLEGGGDIRKGGDENLLFRIIQATTPELSEELVSKHEMTRPVPGAHVSLFSRLPFRSLSAGTTRPGWSIPPKNRRDFIETLESNMVSELLQTSPQEVKVLHHSSLAWALSLEADMDVSAIPTLSGFPMRLG